MRLCSALALFFACSAVCQNISQPLTHVEACRSIKEKIVRVDTDTMHGTGFIVGSNGWIVTAFHVIADRKTLVRYGNIRVVVLGHSHPFPADVVSPLDELASSRDFAILKIAGINLPALELGSDINVDDGSPIAIVGFPLTAFQTFDVPMSRVPPFCLTGTVAAHSAFQIRGLDFLHTIYFQGVSIKGISGAPIVSPNTGKVIGVVTASLAGIDSSLQKIRGDIERYAIQSRNGGAETHANMGGVDPSIAIRDIVAALDDQLANGLGVGAGASDVAIALGAARQEYERQRSHK